MPALNPSTPPHNPSYNTIMSPGKVSTLDFEKFYNIIDGQQRGSDNIHNGINPTSGEKLWDVPIGSEKDLNDAVASAKKAFPAWAATPVEKRKEHLGKLIELFTQHNDEFVSLLCKESGKPVRFAHTTGSKTEANLLLETIRRHGGWRSCRLYRLPHNPRHAC
jgi:acyl-CoA reductase-like NAD-dependent aldehyde dehydrogenase